MPQSVVIVGAGCAGTLTAVNLLRNAEGPPRVVLVERSGTFGPGVAYGTRDERHRLNVAAERMSAFDDEPAHFARWVQREIGPQPRGAYVRRAHFGAYLRDLLADAAAEAARAMPPRRLERVTGEAVDVETTDAGAAVVLADGRRLAADHVVLALGPLPAVAPTALPDDPRVIADPWAPGALADAGDRQTSLVVGSGLTGVDVALSLCGAGPRSRVIAISRGGCLPFDQLPGLRDAAPAPPPPDDVNVETLERWLGRHVRDAQRAGHDWRDAIDGVRPHVQRLWQSLPITERRRFVRQRSRAWELRRHRMAPETAAQVRDLLADGRLLVRAGRLVAVRALRETVEVLVTSAPEELRTLRVDRVVICTGPGTDVRGTPSRLPRALLARGVASVDPLALGLRATPGGALLSADDRPQPRLHVLGPLRRGELWETTAVPEIRTQAATIARAIAGEAVRV
ncbi:FAD/NAD(P)-binding protein [Conexibacter woesei]|uniref:FAD-dependent pyridine nucleotide-disulphide oxidoreductase n=1 Tax=Conexibacter woesei (strain DSM 14684 / CCUG 47730 / CIP 108061 / JCM 11494 / NBRC 100937 / ID131577) TaxID=469383 RepID=D3F7I8_CONWI|nr:FAD/NAD(P)-binding protein [Conexibacter woesei]ADB50850.1 FAD-dependent pyridine nucleotide-disulphide oxidoreductase [Conexibacter woesei DSM 14684]